MALNNYSCTEMNRSVGYTLPEVTDYCIIYCFCIIIKQTKMLSHQCPCRSFVSFGTNKVLSARQKSVR